jgi:NAD(P)-dependent dehydrogenase (short-subunit alcohol dehydrogenase family)
VSSRVAVITGASHGIGAGLVAGYREAGYSVVGVALHAPPSQESDYVTVEGDVAQPETAERVVNAALDRFGRIDTLVNNAGIYIGDAHDAVHQQAAAHGRELAGPRWEIYGHWREDPSELETEVFWLLR